MSPDVLEVPRWWRQRRRSECLGSSPALGRLEEEPKRVMSDIPGQEIAFGVTGFLKASDRWARPRDVPTKGPLGTCSF